VSARDFVAGLGLREGAGRTVAAMIETADGRATIGGRSVALGHPDDRALLRELRTAADAVLVGARTLEAERYARLLDDDQVAYRRELGLGDHPLIATISRSLDVSPDVPVFHEDVPVLVYTEVRKGGQAPFSHAHLTPCSPRAVVEHLRAERGVRGIACEGGPGLLRELIAEGLIDDLLVTVSPLIAGGDARGIVTGDALPEPARLELRAVHRADDHVFLHYATCS
jgi:riboflavin biosynthesis pyrimidine reductase